VQRRLLHRWFQPSCELPRFFGERAGAFVVPVLERYAAEAKETEDLPLGIADLGRDLEGGLCPRTRGFQVALLDREQRVPVQGESPRRDGRPVPASSTRARKNRPPPRSGTSSHKRQTFAASSTASSSSPLSAKNAAASAKAGRSADKRSSHVHCPDVPGWSC